MSATLVAAVAALVGAGVYLATSRVLTRIVLGFAMLGHAAVLALVTSGGPAGDPPLADRADPEEMSNPLPQALSLTAIVISFGLTLFLLALALRQHDLSGDDLVEDDLEDRRIASGRGADADPASAPGPDEHDAHDGITIRPGPGATRAADEGAS